MTNAGDLLVLLVGAFVAGAAVALALWRVPSWLHSVRHPAPARGHRS